ncbi:TIGR04282 family arsenosugar biosynthesis glycosyltransferase [Acaryochloris sp. IP29b_bin.137]|uniref:TIGR04282 family arsenosugar biosynthesis glycosyltransferase n=1 Tax=Acaryochloris sp. IP29b_bin.137 TaxID=2969217 RepID=UPI0026376272|nr:TIGR04282 family arsenosugar biosynthesis glycosyltransferase [Acaryochloris sp. IP29b_bin.137]
MLFVKNPVPGKVKSRLGRCIGFEKAAALYRCFARDLLLTTQQLGIDQLIFYAPADAQSDVQDWLGPQYIYCPQHGEDLGERMAHAFTTCFERGYDGALITGSDSPDLPLSYLQIGLEALRQQQIVIGPSDDGGYYTLGFTPENYTPAVFLEMPWSTSTVFEQTINRLRSCPVYQLPTWYDVDTLEDLRHFHHRLSQTKAKTESRAFLQQHLDLLGHDAT